MRIIPLIWEVLARIVWDLEEGLRPEVCFVLWEFCMYDSTLGLHIFSGDCWFEEPCNVLGEDEWNDANFSEGRGKKELLLVESSCCEGCSFCWLLCTNFGNWDGAGTTGITVFLRGSTNGMTSKRRRPDLILWPSFFSCALIFRFALDRDCVMISFITKETKGQDYLALTAIGWARTSNEILASIIN